MNHFTNDKSIRLALLNDLSDIEVNDEALILEELNVGNARVDVAVLNDNFHGYELKSDIDTLARLTTQSAMYNLIFDKITLVVAKKHLISALQIIPDWWGITVAKMDDLGEVKLIPIRESVTNPEQSLFSLALMLWRHEAIDILINHKKNIRGIRGKSKQFICKTLVEEFDENELRTSIKKKLINRYSLSLS